MKNFVYYNQKKIIFGRGILSLSGKDVFNNWIKVFMVYGNVH